MRVVVAMAVAAKAVERVEVVTEVVAMAAVERW